MMKISYLHVPMVEVLRTATSGEVTSGSFRHRRVPQRPTVELQKRSLTSNDSNISTMPLCVG